jgi:hypothetical protein
MWMPGVHSDIGGSSDGMFLGDISLLTMLELLGHYCPEVELDTNEIDGIVEELNDLRKIVITDEGWTRVLGRGHRLLRKAPYNILHPIYPHLENKTFFNRDTLSTYSPKNVPAGYPLLIPDNRFIELGKVVHRVLRRQNGF